jgi:hypothetical protein
MDHTWHRLALSVLVIVGLRTVSVSGRAGAPAFPVLVVVDDRAAVRPGVLDEAQKEAFRIFWHDAVSISWLTAPASNGSSMAPEDVAAAHRTFVARLIVQPRLPRDSVSTSKFVMGAAPAGSRDCSGEAYIFLDQIVGFSQVRRADVGTVMGTVAAHEIGHLLLRRRAHAAEGLMRAPWTLADWQRATVGMLLFSPSEARTIKTTISSCQ